MADKPSFDFDDAAEQITRTGSTWASGLGQSTVVTYAMRSTAPDYDAFDVGTFARFNAQQISVATLAFQAWADVAEITFNRVGSGTTGPNVYSDNASILLGGVNNGADFYRGFAYLPGETGVPADRDVDAPDGDVYLNNIWDFVRGPALWNRGFLVMTHEIGHAIGLMHPGDYNRAPGVEITYDEHAEYREDTTQYSLMSYFGETETGANYRGFYPAAPQLHDIAAAQRLYGANMTTRTGDTTYGFNSTADRVWYSAASASAPIIFCAWDAGGTDMFNFSGYAQNQIVDLRENAFSNVGGMIGNISIAQGAVIENAWTGAGNDRITGNDSANQLQGGGGDDVVIGGLGDDALIGGAGTDRMEGGAGFDTARYGTSASGITADLNLGTVSTGSWGVDTLVSVENISATAFADTLKGSNAANNFTGAGGADTLDGRGGNDVLNGGAGIDIVRFDSAATGVVVDLRTGTASGDGSDQLIQIENAVGTRFADTLSGSKFANRLEGGIGSDTLDGREAADMLLGGAGNDRLTGGTGGDTFFFAVLGDSIGAGDIITDLSDLDTIDLAAIDANELASGNQAFRLVSDFSDKAGELVIRYSTSNEVSRILGDTDGDGNADLVIRASGDHRDFEGFVF